MTQIDRIINEKDAAAMLGLNPRTLQRHSEIGKAPPRVRITDRRVGYRESDLQTFIATRTSDDLKDR